MLKFILSSFLIFSLLADQSAWSNGTSSKIVSANVYQGGPNLIMLGDFENGTTSGWSLGTTGTLTNGLPTGSPSFGSGASGNLSLVNETSTPISGYNSLGYVSSAATTAGNMVASSAFTIGPKQQAKVLTVSFYYGVSSGAANVNASATSSNSYAWALYDVTNSVWLSSAGNFCVAQTNMGGYCTGTAQTNSNTASVRAVVYNANATAGAATLYLDDFYVGLQAAPMGPAISDWIAYTPTLVGFGSTTNVYVFSRRDGSDLVIAGSFTDGTTSGVAASVTLGYNGGNSNVSIDTTKINATGGQNQQVGWGGIGVATQTAVSVLASQGNTGILLFGVTGNGSYNSLLSATGSQISAGSQQISFYARVPIAGWSSNSVASSDTDTRVVAAALGGSPANVTANNPIIFPTIINDTHGAYNSSTGQYKAPVSGFYHVDASISHNAVAAYLYAYINGSSYAQIGTTGIAVAGGASGQASGTFYLNAGSTFNLDPSQNLSSFSASTMSIYRLSGPAVITATESVNGRYYSTSSSISGSFATVIYSTKGWDTHGAYNASTGVWTCPVSGKYHFDMSLYTSATYTAGEYVGLQLVQSGSSSQTSLGVAAGVPSAGFADGKLSDEFYCLTGDSITPQALSTGGSPTIATSSTRNFISWNRLGN